MFSFGHCQHHLTPTPHDSNWGNLVLFFQIHDCLCFPICQKEDSRKKVCKKFVCGEGTEIYKQPKQQFKVQNIDILEEIDSIH